VQWRGSKGWEEEDDLTRCEERSFDSSAAADSLRMSILIGCSVNNKWGTPSPLFVKEVEKNGVK
jgi:hypothetical protein